MNKYVRIALIVAAVLVVAFFGLRTYTKSHSPEQSAKFDQNGLSVQVNYCSPQMKGRKVFGELVPFGKIWRTGANEATVFEIKQDVKIAEQPLKAGKYSLWTVPNNGNWSVIFNSETGQWGTMHDEKTDVLKVEVPASIAPTPSEGLLIDFIPTATGADMRIYWENTEVKVPVKL